MLQMVSEYIKNQQYTAAPLQFLPKNNFVYLPGVQGSVQESEQGADRGNFQEI